MHQQLLGCERTVHCITANSAVMHVEMKPGTRRKKRKTNKKPQQITPPDRTRRGDSENVCFDLRKRGERVENEVGSFEGFGVLPVVGRCARHTSEACSHQVHLYFKKQ